MDNLKRYTFQLVSLMVLAPLAFTGARTTVSEISTAVPELPAANVESQQVHALELSSESAAANKDLSKSVLRAVKKSIPKKFHHRAYEIARAVINEANHHQMDPFFLLAVIKTESHFNIKARGLHGEIGLMQLLPETANWLAAQAGMTPGQINLEDPRVNIRLGATYFASLRKEFQGYSARYIGAYNMGSGNVYKLMANNMDPSVYPDKVLKNYHNLHKAAAKAADEAAHAPAATAKVQNVKVKKLQTRAVINRCGVNRCKPSAQPLMPDWTST